MDVLTDVLNALELKGWISARRELEPPWHYNFAASQDMIFHLLSSGGGYLSVEGDSAPLRIEGGGVLLFPLGHAHSICDELKSCRWSIPSYTSIRTGLPRPMRQRWRFSVARSTWSIPARFPCCTACRK